jgi:hypothetical protein
MYVQRCMSAPGSSSTAAADSLGITSCPRAAAHLQHKRQALHCGNSISAYAVDCNWDQHCLDACFLHCLIGTSLLPCHLVCRLSWCMTAAAVAGAAWMAA